MKQLVVLPAPWREKAPVPATIDVYREEARQGFVLSIDFVDKQQAHLRIPTTGMRDRRAAEREIAEEIKRQATEQIRDGTAKGEWHWQSFAAGIGPSIEAIHRMTARKFSLRGTS